MPPHVTSTGRWIGGHWPDLATWNGEWVAAWAGVGFIAAGELLQERSESLFLMMAAWAELFPLKVPEDMKPVRATSQKRRGKR